jgi:hypothetical protein
VNLNEYPEAIENLAMQVAGLECKIAALKTLMLPFKNTVENEIYGSGKGVYNNVEHRKAAITQTLLADQDWVTYADELQVAEANLRVALVQLQGLRDQFTVALLQASSTSPFMQKGIGGQGVQYWPRSNVDSATLAESAFDTDAGTLPHQPKPPTTRTLELQVQPPENWPSDDF